MGCDGSLDSSILAHMGSKLPLGNGKSFRNMCKDLHICKKLAHCRLIPRRAVKPILGTIYARFASVAVSRPTATGGAIMLRCLVEIKRPREGATTSRARRPRMRKLLGRCRTTHPGTGVRPGFLAGSDFG